MGQQQLLLLVLGIVIVGIAVVAGIQAFSEGKDKAEQDAAITDATRIISDTQAWKLKPQAFGGGAGLDTTSFVGVNLKALGYPVATSTADYVTTNGCFELAGADAGATIGIYKESASGSCTTASRIATVTVVGSNSDDISWAYAN